jgi:amino acid transporter
LSQQVNSSKRLSKLEVELMMNIVFSLTVAVGVQDRPAEAPQDGPYISTYKLFGAPTFAEAMAAVASIIFAFCGVPAYFSVISEMADPREYPKALALCRGIATSVYLTIGIVVYYYCGDYVASPALGSAGILMKKVCYGLAIPGLIMSMTLYLHVSQALYRRTPSAPTNRK